MGVKDTLQKLYPIRFNVKGKKSLIVAFPYEVAEREARRRDMTVAELLSKYPAVVEYDSFDGVHYTFKETKEKQPA